MDHGLNCSSSSASAAGTSGSAGSTAVAILLVCVSSISTTFGLFFQKIAQDRGGICGRKGDSPKEKRCTFLYWLGGFSLITVISFALDLYSMAQLGQSLVVPLLAGLEVAENQIFAPMILGTPLNMMYDYSSAAIIVVGSLLTSLTGPKNGAAAVQQTSPQWSDDAGNPCNSTELSFLTSPSSSSQGQAYYLENKAYIEALFAEPLFLAYEATVCAIFLACIVVMKFEPACATDNLFLYYGYVAGFLGGQQNLFLKGVGTMIGLAFRDAQTGAAVFSDYLVWIFIVFMLVLAPSQLTFINVGLLKFSITKFVPAYTVLYIIHGTTVGLFFYAEYQQFEDPLLITGFCFGMLLIIGSLGILAAKPPAKCQQDEEELRKVMKIGADSNPLTFILFAASQQIIISRRVRNLPVNETISRMVGIRPAREIVEKIMTQQSVIRRISSLSQSSKEQSLRRMQLVLKSEMKKSDQRNTKVSPQPSPVSHSKNFGFEDSL